MTQRLLKTRRRNQLLTQRHASRSADHALRAGRPINYILLKEPWNGLIRLRRSSIASETDLLRQVDGKSWDVHISGFQAYRFYARR